MKYQKPKRREAPKSNGLPEPAKLLKLVEELSDLAYWRLDLINNEVYWSDGVYRIHGLTREEFTPTQQNSVDIFHPDDLENVSHVLMQALKTGEEFEYQARIFRADGAIRVLRNRGKWEQEDGVTVGIFGTSVDVTEFVQPQQRVALSPIEETQEALKESKERYELAVMGSSVGLWDWNVQSDELYWSPRFKEIVGVCDASFVPHFDEFADRLHPDDRQFVLDALNTHLEKKEPYDVEYRLRHNKGHYVWIHARGQAIWNNSGAPTRMAGSVDDISEKKEAELALEESRQFLELVMDSNPDLVFVKDENLKIIQANEAFMELYPEDQRDKVIGYTTFEDYPEDEVEKFVAQDRAAFRDGFSSTIETIHFPNGGKRVINTRKTRFEDRQGNPFILGVARDVTERENLVADLNRSNEELDQFAYIASHDLLEPLRGIYSNSHFLERDYGDGLDERAIKKIHRTQYLCKHMEKLISDLHFYSRLGKVDGAIEETDLNELVKDVISAMSLEEKNAVVSIENTLPVVKCDRVRVSHVFRNLISNAIKYNESESKEVSVGVKQTSEDDLPHAFYIRDNGIGIDSRFHGDIFRIFKRLHARDKFGGGTGAGLTIVKKIIESRGGEIWLESELKKGTTFSFTLTDSDN